MPDKALLKEALREMKTPVYCLVMIVWGAFAIVAPFANPWLFLLTPPYILINIFVLSLEAAKQKKEDGEN